MFSMQQKCVGQRCSPLSPVGGAATENGLKSVLLIRLEEIYMASIKGGWMDTVSVFEQVG